MEIWGAVVCGRGDACDARAGCAVSIAYAVDSTSGCVRFSDRPHSVRYLEVMESVSDASCIPLSSSSVSAVLTSNTMAAGPLTTCQTCVPQANEENVAGLTHPYPSPRCQRSDAAERRPKSARDIPLSVISLRSAQTTAESRHGQPGCCRCGRGIRCISWSDGPGRQTGLPCCFGISIQL